MRRILFFILFLIPSLGAKSQPSEFYFRFVEPNKITINTVITNIISIDGIRHDTVYAYANAEELIKFEKLGYKYTLLPLPSLQNAKSLTMATTLAQMANWDRYPTYEVYRGLLKKFEQDYPTLCKLDSFGTTPNNHKLYVVKLSKNVTTDEAEVEVFYTSTIHGDETTGFIMMLRLTDYLLKNYGTDARATAMLNSMAIFINPDANPDGTYRGGNGTLSGSTRYNANNVDLNRNYPDPKGGNHPDGYLWQPENIDMMSYVSSRHFTLSANFHGGAELANYPWDTWTSSQKTHRDDNWFIKLSRTFADSLHANGPAGYFSDMNNGISNGGDWYVVQGGRQDYMNWWHHCREVTMEISSTKLLPTESLQAFWNYTRAGLLTYIQTALKGFNGVVKNSSGVALKAKVFVNNHDADSSYVYSSSTTGYYSRPIEPGTWQVIYSSPGYISQIHSITIANYESIVNKDIVLVSSQPTTLAGTVTNSVSLGTIGNAKVELLGSTIASIYTNDLGAYSFASIPQDIYKIRISKPGYKAISQQLDVTSPTNTFNFSLEPATYEGFEGALPAEFTSTDLNWVIDNSVYYEGRSSMRSSPIGASGITSMQIPLNIPTAGNISFARKVSSESGYDFLKFFIDGVEQTKWSGDQNWAVVTFPVASGNHIFKWSYSKDAAQTAGSDCAWIDSVTFPASLQNVTFTVKLNSNPCSYVPVVFNNQTIETNTSGQAVFQVGRVVDKTYTATIASLTPITGKIDVQYSDVSKTLDFTGTPVYTVTFDVKSNNVAIQNANVNFNGSDILTSASGSAVFSNVARSAGLTYTVSLAGYQSSTGIVNIFDNKTISIDLVPNATPVYTITYSVKHITTPIANATVIFNGVEQQTSAAGLAVFSNVQQGNAIAFTVSKSGYKTLSGQTNVNANMTINIELTPVYTVTFNVKHLGTPIAGGNVNFNNLNIATQADGTASFNDVLEQNGYNYTVTKTNYKTVSGQVDVTSGKTIDVELIPLFTVIFTLKNQGVPVANADVSFNSLSQQTAADGTATFSNVVYGMGFLYTASKTGYHAANGQVDITDNKNINIEFTPVGILITNNDSKLFTVWPNPFSDDINLNFNLERPSNINLSIYSLDGRFIATIADGLYAEGLNTFSFPGANLNSGSYIIRLRVNKNSSSQIIQHLR